MIIGFSGKINSGKSSMAQAYLTYLKKEGEIHSFADIIKEKASADYNFNINLCYSFDGKNTHIDNNLTVREALQMTGDKLRKYDPGYIIRCMCDKIKANIMPFSIIDDIRLPEEYACLRQYNSCLVRMEPNENWKAGSYANHITETALDEGYNWDICLTMPLQHSDLTPYCEKIQTIVDEKIRNLHHSLHTNM